MTIFYTQKQAREYLNVSRMTILRYEEKGMLQPVRLSSGHRRYPKEQLDALVGYEEKEDNKKRTCIIYSRVSTKKQQEAGNLDRQTKRLVMYALEQNYEILDIVEEVASGINENRRQLNKALLKVATEDVDVLLAEYKDRVARFGYKYIEMYCSSHGTEIKCVENQEQRSLNEEMVQDMISIITSFSAKLYGQRGAKKIQERMEELPLEHENQVKEAENEKME